MRQIAVITTSRADYGIYRPVWRALAADGRVRPLLIAGGAHLSARHGGTLDLIRRDGLEPAATVDCLADGDDDSPQALARATGRAVAGFAEALAGLRPDLAVVLGDRYEMHAAALAALPLRLPLAHIHGGEITVGAIDDCLRHCLTKLSHLHLVSTDEHARRVVQLGEEPHRVHVVGAPGLDNLRGFTPLSDDQLRRRFQVVLPARFLLATFHPVTLEADPAPRQAAEWLAALDQAGLPVIFTRANADPGGQAVNQAVAAYLRDHADSRLLSDLGGEVYFTLMSRAAAMVGNSSSGIIEAPTLGLPVVNVGRRQEGRLRAANVIDVPLQRAAILAGIQRAVEDGFRASLAGLVNPYGDGRAAERILAVLRDTPLEGLIPKRFHDLPPGPPPSRSGGRT